MYILFPGCSITAMSRHSMHYASLINDSMWSRIHIVTLSTQLYHRSTSRLEWNRRSSTVGHTRR
jgi:hypothetical protein